MTYISFAPHELSPRQRHHYLLGMVNPRPICFASTIGPDGKPNLAPYSFFNIFSSTPPILIFSVGNKRDGSGKDTLINARAHPEVVINMVSYAMARQMAICGVEYETGISEFDKGGFTPEPSVIVKPFRVKESMVQFECKVLEIKTMGNHPGAANLIIAEVLLIHADKGIFAPDDTIDPAKLDMVGRLGNLNYCRIIPESVFEINQPQGLIALGFDNLPASLKTSTILTGHYLAMMAGVVQIPAMDEVILFSKTQEAKEFFSKKGSAGIEPLALLHTKIRDYLDNRQVEKAWLLFLASEMQK
jgi:flavin reductase (DIM6/NTAB) family NADH-FMN oxidoreductase RutF